MSSPRIQTFLEAITFLGPDTHQQTSPWSSAYKHHARDLAPLLPKLPLPSDDGVLESLVKFTASFHRVSSATAKKWLSQDPSDLQTLPPHALKNLKAEAARSNALRRAAHSLLVSRYLARDTAPTSPEQALKFLMARSPDTSLPLYATPDLVGIAVDMFRRTPAGRSLRKVVAELVEEMIKFPGRDLMEDAQTVLEGLAGRAVERGYGMFLEVGRYVKHGPHMLAVVLVVVELQGNAEGRVREYQWMRGVARRVWGGRVGESAGGKEDGMKRGEKGNV
ncbi:uncharacterized protein BDZ99DRAFT_477336 [Mytilinidion resinicola]|uniref:Uncharacterized protein n=1 Tax=Mytilinidion resinicola TaxID=574789 RepID=A0A6A6YIZ0_9PEZI|nr:uncharacterized protein BDZ99DRAFT_477336 [Mytilinidion resinicola]KAF2808826.1 hypothetical protein BDZ99DRAFT_477336 [Mytilinidion resinicola]